MWNDHFSQHSLPTLTGPPLSPFTLPVPGKLIYMWWPSFWWSCWAHVNTVMETSNASEIFSVLSSLWDPCMSSEATPHTPGLEGERGYQQVSVWGEDHLAVITSCLELPGCPWHWSLHFARPDVDLTLAQADAPHTCLIQTSPPTSARPIVPMLSVLPQTQAETGFNILLTLPSYLSFGFLEISPT